MYTLEQMGFSSRGFADGISMIEALKSEKPRLIVLDVMMPGLDGIEVLKKLKSSMEYKDIPVIMATAKGTEMDKIEGLNTGADDYLVKPFGVMEMVARVNAVLRRTGNMSTGDDITVGLITLKQQEHVVISDGEKIELTHKEFKMLKLFMQNPHIVFSRERLMNEIWGTDYVGESRTVDVHIKTLRRNGTRTCNSQARSGIP